MSKRQAAVLQADHVDENLQDPPADSRRTRSGLRLGAPVAAPRRTASRRSVISQEESEAKHGASAEEQYGASEPAADTEKPNGSGDCPLFEPEPTPALSEMTPAQPKTTSAQLGPTPNKKPRLVSLGKPNLIISLGKPKSGRVWKNRNKQRFSAVVRDKSLCSSWEKKMAAKREKELVKKYALQLKEEQARKEEEKKKRREDNLKRRAENERKAEIVQVIRNTAKIKRMKKKQLRKIEKRDTLTVVQKSETQNVTTSGKKKL
ncbi:coiled-coil domain-containing protein 86 [Thalassophryne amazonica]|uniref:coiled-coil domain-containing protein 86 n=1 Tax=Thalassophryne amazonica TaxID=390379 RepID=UPI001472264B|nr:coiled-coil domain-containing protein 86 [Thalassophryne amazonica]